MSGVRLAVLVIATIDAALPVGVFGGGQHGLHPDERGPLVAPDDVAVWPLESASVLWCADYADMKAVYPSFPQSQNEEEDAQPGGCVDLMIEFDSQGRLSRAALESLTIEETLAALGDDVRATQARALYGVEARAASSGLAQLLDELFATARRRAT